MRAAIIPASGDEPKKTAAADRHRAVAARLRYRREDRVDARKFVVVGPF